MGQKTQDHSGKSKRVPAPQPDTADRAHPFEPHALTAQEGVPQFVPPTGELETGRLLKRPFLSGQRQTFARAIGRQQGNRHLDHLVSRLQPNGRVMDSGNAPGESGAPRNGNGRNAPDAAGVGIEAPPEAQAFDTAQPNEASLIRIRRSTSGQLVQRQNGGGSSTPIPRLAEANARNALALDILKKAYGALIKKESKIEGLDSGNQLRDEYDAAMARQGKTFKEEDGTIRPWGPKDSRKHKALTGAFPGFHDPSTGKIFIDLSRPPDEQVATVAHELLHANAAGDFQSTLGRNVDEGVTETLTIKAFSKAGYGTSFGFFGGQVALVGKLSAMFGENTMMMAYFRGTAILRSMMDATLEEGTFERFAIEVRGNNTGWLNAFFNRWREAMGGSELDKKIAAINGLLDWWVSDADLDSIQNIWNGATDDEKQQIRYAIQPRVGDLSDHGQRARLRAILGS